MLHSGDAGGLLELDRSETQETVVPEDTNDNQHSVTFDARALAPMLSAAGRNSPMDVEGAPGAEAPWPCRCGWAYLHSRPSRGRVWRYDSTLQRQLYCKSCDTLR